MFPLPLARTLTTNFPKQHHSYELLTRVYGFEPMPEEINLFVVHMELRDDKARIGWEDFDAKVTKIRDIVKKISTKATQ